MSELKEKEKEGLLELKQNVNSHSLKILDAQDIPQEEKDGIKEFFSYMGGLTSQDLAKLKDDPKFAEASVEYKKDRSKSEIIINACEKIIKDDIGT